VSTIVGIGNDVKSAMPADKYRMIFGTCGMLLNVNTQLLQHLDEVCTSHVADGVGAGAAVDWSSVCIGDKLNMFFPMFKLYTQYSDQYDAMALCLSQLMGDDDDTAFAQRLHEAMQAHQQTGAFQGLLIQPIQRIPRYPLLLDRLIELTPEDHSDHAALVKANEWITGVAQHLNKSLTTQEEQLQLVKLQSVCFPKTNIVKSGRRLVLRGDLIKIAAKDETEQKYHFFLFNDAIMYGKKIMEGFYKIHRLMNLQGIKELPYTDGQNNRFVVIGDKKEVMLGAASLEIKMQWVNAVQKSLADIKTRQKSFQDAGLDRSTAHGVALGNTEVMSEAMSPLVGYSWQRSRSRSRSPTTSNRDLRAPSGGGEFASRLAAARSELAAEEAVDLLRSERTRV